MNPRITPAEAALIAALEPIYTDIYRRGGVSCATAAARSRISRKHAESLMRAGQTHRAAWASVNRCRDAAAAAVHQPGLFGATQTSAS